MNIALPEPRESWRNSLHSRPRGGPEVGLITILQTTESGSGAFLALADDGANYWIKPLGNPQGDLVLVTERIVAAIGEAIEAPVRPVILARIPAELAGWSYASTHRLNEGLAHASLHLESAEEDEGLLYPRRDDNSTRYPLLMALWDLCMGGDEQWLHDQATQFSVWSFDHGWWLGGEPDWTGDILAAHTETEWAWRGPLQGLSALAFHEAADRVELLTSEEILRAVSTVPVDWAIPDWELETVAWVIYRRRAGVAARLRSLAART